MYNFFLTDSIFKLVHLLVGQALQQIALWRSDNFFLTDGIFELVHLLIGQPLQQIALWRTYHLFLNFVREKQEQRKDNNTDHENSSTTTIITRSTSVDPHGSLSPANPVIHRCRQAVSGDPGVCLKQINKCHKNFRF